MPYLPPALRTRRVRPLLVGVLLLLGVPAQAQDSFSIEEILSAPFPSDLTAAPTGDRVAWVQDKEGIRSLWTAAGPSYQARRVIAAEGDDGQRTGEVTFTPDGEQIVYVRGGAPNRNGPPMRTQEARFNPPAPRTNSLGEPATALSFPGKKPGGCACIRFPPTGAKRLPLPQVRLRCSSSLGRNAQRPTA